MRIVEAVVNISEGRDSRSLRKLEEVINDVPQAYLLGCDEDYDHNRAVFTLAGSPGAVLEAVWVLFQRAIQLIDMRSHQGVHPCLGAVDVIPFVPSQEVSMADCQALASCLGDRIGRECSVPVFLYEAAATHRLRRSLAALRKGGPEGLKKRMSSDPLWKPDFGPSISHPTAGVVAIGARDVLIAFNVFLNSPDLEAARSIAQRIRESSGGLIGVKALGFYLAQRNQAQVSINLTDYKRTSMLDVFEAVQLEARRVGLEAVSSEIIGLAPVEALDGAVSDEIGLEGFGPERILEDRIAQVIPDANP